MVDLEKGLKPCPFCETKENGDDKIRMHLAENSEELFHSGLLVWRLRPNNGK